MSMHSDKTREDKSKQISGENSGKQGADTSAHPFNDSRPATIVQRRLQEIADNSPQVQQQKAMQMMANNRGQAKKAIQMQTVANDYVSRQAQPVQKKENNTGLPDNLKSGVENLSGQSMDDVQVHYNSDKPAQVQAHAYAQGTDIHLAPGQEKHLPHEAWHVVQQKQGRVQPTMQMKGAVAINDDEGLEKEADEMGAKALQRIAQEEASEPEAFLSSRTVQRSKATIQRMIWTYNGLSWNPASFDGVDYSKKPSAKDKPQGTTYDDTTSTFTYPAKKEEEKADTSAAGKAKMEKIQPYLDLIDHLAGEFDGTTAKGGHLLLEMEAKWKDRFKLDNPGDKKDDAKWQAQWSIDGKKKGGGSTMFPASWDKAELRKQLLASSTVGGKITLSPSGIVVKKAGGTFYPDK